ncbi:hypothetical protein NEDG_00516 [Nematocida displodere]|uniref:Uncharacterized protein n=1 Tax=Nematocida displodere TaxID=1805483 RepID=A0A177EKQ8_9MICR|nr:hypothetical protein NEDG_00516 [Nematocida displodere]
MQHQTYPNNNMPGAPTQPNMKVHRLVRKAALTLMYTALGVAVLSRENIDLPYLDSPDTSQTLVFFKASECDLLTCVADGGIHIAKNQWMGTQIRLNNYRLEAIPEQLVQGLKFEHLTISTPPADQPGLEHPRTKKLLKRVFQALSAVHTNSLSLTGLDLEDREDTKLLGPVTKTRPKKHLKLHANHLNLASMSATSMRWLLKCLDVSECELTLHISNAPTIKNLRFLNTFAPKALLFLHVDNAENLANIDCTLLTEKKVLNGLELTGTKKYLGASGKTLKAIRAKHWGQAWLYERLLCVDKHQGQKHDPVDSMSISIDFVLGLDSFWSITYENKAWVKTLKLRLTNRHNRPRSSKTLKDLFAWIDRTFKNTETITITDDDGPSAKTFRYRYICIDPHLPDLKHLYYEPFAGRVLQRYSPNGILWIASNMYSDWITGRLSQKIHRLCKKKILSIDGSVPTPFLPPACTAPNTNPRCFECKWSLDELSEMMDGEPEPIYVGIACPNGHMACISCLEKITRASPKPLLCPCCGTIITNPNISAVIESGGCFKLVTHFPSGQAVRTLIRANPEPTPAPVPTHALTFAYTRTFPVV